MHTPTNNAGPALPRRMRFHPGVVLISPGAESEFLLSAETPQSLLARHVSGDWGELDEQDCESNERAVPSRGYLLSVYRLSSCKKVYIKTEPGHGTTTIYLPSEH